MKISYCILVMMSISFGCNSQSKMDSLRGALNNALEKRDQESEVYTLFQIAHHFYQSRNYDSAIHNYNKMLERAPSDVYRASALNGIGVAYSDKGLPAQSITYYSQAIALYDKLKDTANVVTATYNLAIIYKDMGLYEDALEISFKNLSRLEKQGPSRTLGSSYNTIGTVYARVLDYQKAYEFYRKSLMVRAAIRYEQGMGQSYANIGELFNQIKQYDSALVNLQRAVDIRRKMGDKRGLGRVLTITGTTLNLSGKSREAVVQLSEAISLNRTSEDIIGEILTLHEFGAARTSLKEYGLAEKCLDSALALVNRTKTHDYLKANLELRANLFRQKHDLPRLVAALDNLAIVKDSLLNQEKVESLLALDIQYETERKKQEIALLQQQRLTDQLALKKNQLQIISLIVLTVFLVVVAGLGYRLYFVTQREKKSSDLHNKEMHHRTKNNLQMLSSFFTIQASILEDDKRAQELIVETQGRVKTMALVHNKLYQEMNASELNLQDYITDLVTSLLYSYGFTGNRLRLELDVAEVSIDIDKAVRIGLIINELITNALKYAYRDQVDPLLKVLLSKAGTEIAVEVTDNGLYPLPLNVFENSRSFGLRMVKLFVRELKGQIGLRNNFGSSFRITFP